jgi:hypothetical protein
MKTKLIPRAIAYAKDCKTIENHSFQSWLQEVVEREDLIAWARDWKETWTEPKEAPKGFRAFVSQLVP